MSKKDKTQSDNLADKPEVSKVVSVEIKAKKMNAPESDTKPSWGSTVVDYFNSASDKVQTTGKKALVFAKKTADENPALLEAAVLLATTLKVHPKIRMAVIIGHTLYRASQQKPK